jgi:LysR family hydrogen peroxide-inducible transcriptional activator
VELYQLNYFEAAARTGSMQAAAAACHVSQPALSVQIKNLEKECGHRLLVRTARGVSLTPAGQRMLATARRIREETATLRRDLRRRHFGTAPRLRIGLQPFLASDLFARPLRVFLRDHPDWQVTLRERANDRLIDLLLGEQVDVCLMTATEGLPSSVETRRLFCLRYMAYCLPESPLARRRSVRLRDLLPQPLLVSDDPSQLVEQLHTTAETTDVETNIVLGSDHALTAFELAAEGLGVAILPEVLAGRARRRGLRALPLAERALQVEIIAAWRRNAPLPEGFNRLLGAMEQSR